MAAIPYDVPPTVVLVAAANAFRPYPQLTVDDFGPYLLGLFYIPFVIVGFFILYLGLLVGLFACRRRGQIRSVCCGATCIRLNKCLLVVGLALGVGVLIGSVVSSVLMFENAGVIKNQFAFFTALFGNLTTDSQVFSGSMADLATGTRQFNCPETGTPADAAAEQLRQEFAAIVDQLTQSARSLQSGLESGQNDFDATVDIINYVVNVLSVVCVSLSSAMLVIALMTAFALAFVLRRFQGGEGRVGCCQTCCSPGCWCVVLIVVLMVVFCSAAHIVALAFTDVCYPQVDDNLNFLLGEFTGFSVPRNGSCDAVFESTSAPTVMNSLCYVQTCDDRSDLATLPLSELQSAIQFLNDVNVTALPSVCDSLSLLLNPLLALLGAGVRTQVQLQCSNVNPPYAALMYDSLCNEQVKLTFVTFVLWMTAVSCFMVCHLYWEFLLGAIEHEAKLPVANQVLMTETATAPLLSPEKPSMADLQVV